MKKVRDSSFELLRIISILMIVSYHYFLWGDWHFKSGFQLNHITQMLFSNGGLLGVMLFVFITGYFSIHKKTRLKAIIPIWVTTSLTSALILTLAIVLNQYDFKIFDIIKVVFAPVYNLYWFVSSFIILLLLEPILNKVLNECTKKQFQMGLLIGFIVLYVVAIFYLNSKVHIYGSPLYMAYYYAIGAYLSKYQEDFIGIKKYKMFLVTLVAYIVMNIYNIAIMVLKGYNNELVESIKVNTSFALDYLTTSKQYNIFVLIMAIAIFIFFMNVRVFKSKTINYCGKASFSIYLFQSSGFLSWYTTYAHPNQTYSSFKMIINCFQWTLLMAIGGIIVYTLLAPFVNIITKKINLFLKIE